MSVSLQANSPNWPSSNPKSFAVFWSFLISWALGGGAKENPPREPDPEGGGGKENDERPAPVSVGLDSCCGRRRPNLPPRFTVIVSPSFRERSRFSSAFSFCFCCADGAAA